MRSITRPGSAFAVGVVLAAGWIALWAIELNRAEQVRLLPRWTWALPCMFCVPLGALCYLAVGRTWGRGRRAPGPTGRSPGQTG